MPDAPTLDALAAALAEHVDAARGWREGDPAGVWIASDRPVRRLGLRLEAGRAPYPWAESLDAVLLHRPFGLWPARVPEGVGALAYHGGLDREIWTGDVLLRALGATPEAEPLRRDGQPIGTVSDLNAPVSWEELAARLAAEVGVEQAEAPGQEPVARIAVVGAMTEALVEDAAARGATVYVTGQIRKPGRAALARTGLGVIATGQAASEWWGLRWLGAIVRQRWPGVEVVEV